MLKKSIDDASKASLQPTGGYSYNESDLRFIHNLRELLNAARQFHTSASSTAGSIREGTSGPWVTSNSEGFSEAGDFPPNRRRWVENYIRAGRDPAMFPPDSPPEAPGTQRRAIPARQLQPSLKAAYFAETESISSQSGLYESSVAKAQSDEKTRAVEDPDDCDDDCGDAEAEQGFQQRLQNLAKDMIRRQDYRNAVDFLHKALQSGVRTTAAQAERRQLQIQLTLCHFLQGDREQAEVCMSCVSKARNDRDAVVCTLLHALALAHLLRYSFDMALSIGQRALQGRKRLLLTGAIDCSEVDESRALLATIYNVRGGNDDYIRADVFREQISKNFNYVHPENEVAFITNHPTLISTVLGSEIPASGRKAPKDPGLPAGAVPRWIAGWPTHGLSKELAAHERYKQDTEKYVISSSMWSENSTSPQFASVRLELEGSTVAATPASSTRSRLARATPSSQDVIAASREDAPGSGQHSSVTVSPTSRWLRFGRVFGLRKGGCFIPKELPHKFAAKQPDERRPGLKWISRRMTRKMSAGSEEKAHCEDAGHRITEWVRTQPRDIEASSIGSEACYPGSEAGGSIVSQVGCYMGTCYDQDADAVPFMPDFASSHGFDAFADDNTSRSGPDCMHEMDGTHVAALDDSRGPGIDDMLDTEMNDIGVSEINNLSPSGELSGNKSVQVDIVSENNHHFGCANHGLSVSSIEAEAVSSPVNQPLNTCSSALLLPCLSLTEVRRKWSGSDFSIDSLQSTGEVVENPISNLRNMQLATDGANALLSLRSPHISDIPAQPQHGELLTTMCCPDQPLQTNGGGCLSPVRPIVIGPSDNRLPGLFYAGPKTTHLEEYYPTKVLVDETIRGIGPPARDEVLAAENAGMPT